MIVADPSESVPGSLTAIDALVASQGFDIPQVTTVINYDPPKNLDVHFHRVGRAGRLLAQKNGGDDEQQPKEGSAYTLLRTPKDADIGHVLLGALERELAMHVGS